ncbi:haloacid dehalogenase superfamily, subfamily IA, variant 3 [Bacteroidales bacterium 6E]|nr:haloacid dehalogenase superfamily, subfamily IA, variant 3 [Bacteroidales bacterium 6E]
MQPLPEFTAVIFDMDGVLINSETFYSEMEQVHFKMLGLNIPHEEHVTYQGTATDEMWRTIKEKHGVPHSLEELVEMTGSLTIPTFQEMEEIPLMPKIKDLLEVLKGKNIPLALASSSYPEVIDIVLDKSGLRKYFPITVNSKMVGKSKPAPDIFLLAAKLLGVNPGECIVIEDSTNGIRAARDAGMYCIAYNGPGAEFQDQSQAQQIITDYGEIIRILGE